MDERLELAASPRTALGKKVKALRRQGLVPIHVYGPGGDPLSLQVDLLTLRPVLRAAGLTTPVMVKVDGAAEDATLVRDIARHPVSGDILHVDFMRVSQDRPVEVDVPIVLINDEDAPGTRGGAGVVTQGLHEITVRARPFDVPHQIEVDCSVLVDLDSVIRVADLVLPAGVEIVGHTDTQVAWIQPPRVTAEPVPTEVEEGAAAEAREGEEGAADEEGKEEDES